jgi:ribonuclease HII
MAWICGIDEAGYGPNLGPFVMSAVVCSVPDAQADTCLWELLKKAVRRGNDWRDGRLVVDDSKVVHVGPRGLAGLEAGTFAVLGGLPEQLGLLVRNLCLEQAKQLQGEAWFTGQTALPAADKSDELLRQQQQFADCCSQQGVTGWAVRSAIICPPWFNTLIERGGSKSAVLSEGFMQLLRWVEQHTSDGQSLTVFIDKQGGRNSYSGQIQQALDTGMVLAEQESLGCSRYRVEGRGRPIRLTFQPRADSACFCVALASMVSKYLRELCMAEFNAFWSRHVPGLRATAGYPSDAPRFLEAIRPVAQQLQIPIEAIWRSR